MALGTDIVEISRIRRAAQRHPAFWQRILTPAEQAYCQGRGDGSASLAGRFAAKEAIMKCLGAGMDQLSFTDIEVINDQQGRPKVCPGVALSSLMSQLNIRDIEVSISHCREYAVAVALAHYAEPSSSNSRKDGAL